MSHGMKRFIATLFLACLSLSAQAVEVVTYYHNDALGSPIIATDQEGRVVWRKSYAPYGQPIGPGAPNEPGYTRKFEEPDLGIQDFGARWYDPRIGRFLAIDPAGFDPQNLQSFNRYAYANNNPYRYVDPDGRWAEDAVLGIPSVVIGAASLSENIANGNWGSAALDAVGIVGDSIAVGVPAVPGGIGLEYLLSRRRGRRIRSMTRRESQTAKGSCLGDQIASLHELRKEEEKRPRWIVGTRGRYTNKTQETCAPQQRLSLMCAAYLDHLTKF